MGSWVGHVRVGVDRNEGRRRRGGGVRTSLGRNPLVVLTMKAGSVLSSFLASSRMWNGWRVGAGAIVG